MFNPFDHLKGNASEPDKNWKNVTLEELDKLLDACRNYPLPNRRRITFEYVMIKGLNDSIDDAKRIVKLLKGIPSKVNLLPYNESEGSPFKRPDKETVNKFHKYLGDRQMTVIIRSSKGSDISAACGQLKGEVEKE